jgi:aminopeptidase N
MPAAEITRAETGRRARLLRVQSQEIALDLTPGPEVFGSESVIRFDCAEPGAASYVDLVAEAVHEITLNGVRLDPAAVCQEDGRITLPGLAARNELRVVADCAYTGSGTGMHRADPAGQETGTYIYAKLAQAYARTAYACFDQPDLKAEFTFAVTVPGHWTVLSNSPVRETSAQDGQSATWHFATTPRLPAFTTTVVAGDYHVVTASHTTPGGQQIPLELACRQSMARYLDEEALLETTRQGLDFYTQLLGPYPYRKYGQVFVPEFSAGASEDAGCVLFTEQFLFRSRVTAAMEESRATVQLHEMAHMWFGDLVSVRWWDDLWLSESFANFCEYHAASRMGRFPGAWSSFSAREKAWAFAQDRLPSTHPVAADAATLSEAIANFDGITYAKGAAVLRQLAAYAGEENFFAGVRAYLTEHAFANATRDDLIAAVAASSGKDLTAWSKAWLETAGPSTLRCELETGTIRQDTPGRPHHVAVGLYERSGGELVRTRRVAVDIAGERTEVPELAGLDEQEPDLILLNDDDTGYAMVRFDPRSLRTVLESAGELADAAARAVCWNTLSDMVRQAELPVPVYAAALARGIRREPSVSVLQGLASQAEQILVQLAGPRQATAARIALAGAAAELVRGASGDHQLAGTQLLSWTATSPEQLDLIEGLLEGGAEPDLRWALLLRLAAAGRAGDDRIDTELAGDPTQAGHRGAAACRAAIPDAGHKEAAWQLLTSDETGPESLAAIAGGFRQPEQADLLAPYAGRYLAALERIWATQSGYPRVRLGELLFPYPAASPALLAQIDDFVAARTLEPGLARVLAERRDTVRRALLSRELPELFDL